MNVMQSMEEPPEHTQVNIHLRISLYFIPVVQNYLKIKAERNCLNFTIPKHKKAKHTPSMKLFHYFLNHVISKLFSFTFLKTILI